MKPNITAPRCRKSQRNARAMALAQAYQSLLIEDLVPSLIGRELHVEWVEGRAAADAVVARIIAAETDHGNA